MYHDIAIPTGTKAERVKLLITSHSIDSLFDSCARKFEFEHVYGVGARADSGYAADVGTALHEAIQAWARIALAPGAKRDEVTLESARDAGYFELLRWWPWVLEEIGIEERKPSVSQRSLYRAILLFNGVVDAEWWSEWELAIDSDGNQCIEVPWRIVYENEPGFVDHRGDYRIFARQGKIDFVLRNKRTGAYRVVDLKTTNKTAEALDASYRFSGQGAGYAMVLGAVLGLPWREEGLEVTYLGCIFGTIDDPIRDPVPISYTYKGDEIEDMLMVNQDRMDQMRKYGQRGWWPRKSGGCESFGSICPFFTCCHRRDSEFLEKWLAFSDEYQKKERIYEPLWELVA